MVVVGVARGGIGIANALMRRVRPTRQRWFKCDYVLRSRRRVLPLAVGCIDKRCAQGHDHLQRKQQQARNQTDLAVARGRGNGRHLLLIKRS